ncbi:MAG: hypothetical protein WCJ95_13485 [Mariniphaga sp.]
MTKDQFIEFIDEYELYSFDDLIEIIHLDGMVYNGVWISSTPPLDESMDGKFAGKAEHEIFYLFEIDQFVVWLVDEIKSIKCLQQGYLKGLTYQLSL